MTTHEAEQNAITALQELIDERPDEDSRVDIETQHICRDEIILELIATVHPEIYAMLEDLDGDRYWFA